MLMASYQKAIKYQFQQPKGENTPRIKLTIGLVVNYIFVLYDDYILQIRKELKLRNMHHQIQTVIFKRRIFFVHQSIKRHKY